MFAQTKAMIKALALRCELCGWEGDHGDGEGIRYQWVECGSLGYHGTYRCEDRRACWLRWDLQHGLKRY